MNLLPALFILGGYVSLVWVFGWMGLLAAAAHAAVMFLAMGRD
jgi:hypothetical protein